MKTTPCVTPGKREETNQPAGDRQQGTTTTTRDGGGHKQLSLARRTSGLRRPKMQQPGPRQLTREPNKRQEKTQEKRGKPQSPAKSTDQQKLKPTNKNAYNQPHPGPGGKLITKNQDRQERRPDDTDTKPDKVNPLSTQGQINPLSKQELRNNRLTGQFAEQTNAEKQQADKQEQPAEK